MKHQSRRARAHSRRKYRENAKTFKRVSALAGELRDRHDLCRHADERRVYRTIEERDNDKSEPLICAECGRRRLRIAVFLDASAALPAEMRQSILSQFLEQENG